MSALPPRRRFFLLISVKLGPAHERKLQYRRVINRFRDYACLGTDRVTCLGRVGLLGHRACGEKPGNQLAFTRYCFTIKPDRGSQIILLLTSPACKASPNAILLHVHCALYDTPPDPSFVCHTPYNIGNGNIV